MISIASGVVSVIANYNLLFGCDARDGRVLFADHMSTAAQKTSDARRWRAMFAPTDATHNVHLRRPGTRRPLMPSTRRRLVARVL